MLIFPLENVTGQTEIRQYLLVDSDKNKGEGTEELASVVQKHQPMLLKKGKTKKQKHFFSVSQECPCGIPKFTTLWVRNVESAMDFSVCLAVKQKHINFK